ncbi:peptide/nickel transport system permease protein [Rhodococcus rhodochrous J3]|uniref:Peptide/nickel transport system permease protein n=1 Tax=Rhodococcus rhodochrous J3 TaxID=903528 RepID=A0ABY1MCK6_RHORH|nr:MULTISPECIES: ABC transporter permease [Rhodococcus]MBF4481130.1 ABC transporter permease [Rhodococcus rhodochrous]WSE24185.1 ABC transporter permease [Rhodococcus sp. PD04]SMG45162.1 peptide/nickel transport system permease protein [Rhodococcus rhodochrous J3]
MTSIALTPAEKPLRAAGTDAPEKSTRSSHSVLRYLHRNRWWITRVLALPVHVFVFVVLTFLLVRSMPGDPIRAMLGQNYTPESYAAMQERMGLNGTMFQQLTSYLHGIVNLDLGESIVNGRPVIDELQTRLPATLELALLGLGLSILLSIAASYIAVFHHRSVIAHIIRGYARAAGAVPEYVLAVAGILLFYATLQIVPAPMGRLDVDEIAPPTTTGFPLVDALLAGRPDAFWSTLAHLALPVVVMCAAHSALLIRVLVSALDKEADATATRFRIASGASTRTVVKSIYRRAAPASVTMAGTLFGYLLGGTVILETLFGLSGMGKYALDAVNSGDVVVMQGFLLTVATLSLLVFLLVDVTNMLIDPRRRPGVRTEG